jgi:hypothetical protein
MDIGRLTTPQRISAIAILITAIAAFLPWVSFFGISKLGIEGDGVNTLILAIAGAVVLGITSGMFGQERGAGKASQIALLVLAVLTALIGLLDMNVVAAIGLYLTLLAGIAWVVGAVWQLTLPKQAALDADESA